MTTSATPSNPWLLTGDCREQLVRLGDDTAHMVLTDPPYFLDGLDTGWSKGDSNGKKPTGTVGGLPVGMKFDSNQGKALQSFMSNVGEELIRVLKPGAFAVFFSQPRLSHRMAVGIEDAGFEIRDQFAWHFTKKAQFKAFSMNHFIDRLDVTVTRRHEIKSELQDRKTPQLRPQFESLILAQKPKKGTHIQNWLEYQTGLIDATASLDGNSPTTLMKVEKPAKQNYNCHLTVKPVALLIHLIELFTVPGQVVLDPFLGSGSTAVAALSIDRKVIGMEINPDYVQIAQTRIEESIELRT